jgi:hypothetical protein
MRPEGLGNLIKIIHLIGSRGKVQPMRKADSFTAISEPIFWKAKEPLPLTTSLPVTGVVPLFNFTLSYAYNST